LISQSASRRVFSEIAFLSYQAILGTLTMTVVLRFLFEYQWSQCALYSISMVGAYYLGQAIVGGLQRSRRIGQEVATQENDLS